MAIRSEYNQKDLDVTRERGLRKVVALMSAPLTLLLGYLFGIAFTGFFGLPSMLGTSIGLGIGALGVMWLVPRLYVVNDAVSAFVTVDLLSDELVSYGPGFHWSFPWEARSGANNVALDEAAESFTFTVQTKTGTLNGKGSFRLRPDIQKLPEFLAGVASVAAE
jgi:hypothetical protein